jgi:hypothetical protein
MTTKIKKCQRIGRNPKTGAEFFASRNRVHAVPYSEVRWSRFLRQAVKVDLLTQRMIHHEDTQTVYG